MRLLIIINDAMNAAKEAEYTGVLRAPERRAVRITLTESQLASIALDETYERIESVSLLMYKEGE